MIQDGLPHQNPWEDPVMLIFGNVFAFNAALVASMKREWQTVGQVPRRSDAVLMKEA